MSDLIERLKELTREPAPDCEQCLGSGVNDYGGEPIPVKMPCICTATNPDGHEAAKRIEDLEHRLRMIVSHATGGSLNWLCAKRMPAPR